MRAQRPPQRGHEVPLHHVEEDAGDGVLAVEELLERVAKTHLGLLVRPQRSERQVELEPARADELAQRLEPRLNDVPLP